MPLLSKFGVRVSQWLHEAIFSMPSPDHDTNPGMAEVNDLGGRSTLADLIDEPGEPRAIAGGIGPLSFAGSGYGITLVLTVSLAP
jgi:hypothetical protein